jgi:hypothetical protein
MSSRIGAVAMTDKELEYILTVPPIHAQITFVTTALEYPNLADFVRRSAIVHRWLGREYKRIEQFYNERKL